MSKTEHGECAATGNTLIKNERPPSNDTTPLVGIYGFRHKQHGKWYVGQSLDIYDRWSRYKRLSCESQRKWYNALIKYGYDAFEAVIIEQCDATLLDEREIFWIKEKDSVKNGYNIKAGGKGGKHSDETKRLIKAKRSLQVMQPRSEESKEAMRQWNATYWATHDHPFKGRTDMPKRPDLSERNKTTVFTDEQKRRLSDAAREYQRLHGNPMKGRKRPDLAERNRQRAKIKSFPTPKAN